MPSTSSISCRLCKGEGHVGWHNHRGTGKENHGCGIWQILPCPDCDGRGTLTEEQRAELRQCVRGSEFYNGMHTCNRKTIFQR